MFVFTPPPNRRVVIPSIALSDLCRPNADKGTRHNPPRGQQEQEIDKDKKDKTKTKTTNRNKTIRQLQSAPVATPPTALKSRESREGGAKWGSAKPPYA